MNGCVATKTYPIKVDSLVGEEVYTITPNDDGKNDELFFPEIEQLAANKIPDNQLFVINRWGNVVYNKKMYDNDWKGTDSSGNNLPQGTYYFILNLNLADGKIKTGYITLIR